MNFKLFSILLLLLGINGALAQTPVPVIKDNTTPNREEFYKVEDVRGTIKRGAVYLPKPSYPREALEAGADGAVRVEVVLGADGKVISAKAISGHPLLYAAAEETARKTFFRRLETADPNATETGVIVYNFAILKENWMRIGFALAAIQKIPTLRPLVIPRVAKAFETDWTEEHRMLAELAEMRRAELETENTDPVTNGNKPVLVGRPLPASNRPTPGALKAELRVQIPIPNPPSPERIALAQNLSISLQSRLASDELNLWRFNTGIALAKANELLRIPNENRNAAQILRQSLDSAPADASAETLEALRSLIGIFESDRRTIDTRTEIGKQMSIIFNSK